MILTTDKSAQMTGFSNMTKPGVKLVIGTKDVPSGSCTRQVPDKMAAIPFTNFVNGSKAVAILQEPGYNPITPTV